MTIKLDPEGAEARAIHCLAQFAGKDILEIGCGDGRVTWQYARDATSVLAIDPDADEIAKANALRPVDLKTIVTFLAADITTFDLQPSAHDIALFSWSI